MTTAIRFKDLVVEYRTGGRSAPAHRALHGLSLEVAPGETFGFLGPNGAGKTTAMNVLLGFTAAASGSAQIFEMDVRQTAVRQRIGYLPELTYYYRFLTPEELLRFYARTFGMSRAVTDVRIASLLKLVELEHASKRQIRTFSKGMQQRIGVAQALINDPDLLILDEPTSGLDPMGRMRIRNIIKRLKNEGKTVFFSSHELGEVETVCDRVAILKAGRVMAIGNLQEVTMGRQNLEQAFLEVIGFQEEEVA